MARKSPALYELIGERQESALPASGRTPASEHPQPTPATTPAARTFEPKHQAETAHRRDVREPRMAELDSGPLLLRPGSSVRVPVGYFYVGGAIVLGLVVGAFMLGHQAAENAVAREHRLALLNSTPDIQLQDPLAQGSGAIQGAASGSGSDVPTIINGDRQQSQPLNGERQSQRQAVQPPVIGATGSGLPNAYFVGDTVPDPRTRGLNYWVIAQQAPDEAESIARFLSARGIATVVIRSNAQTAQVTTLQGFEGNPARDPDGAELQQRILDLGRLYLTAEGGATNFSDMWARKLR